MDEKLTVCRMQRDLSSSPTEYLIFLANNRGVDLHKRSPAGVTILQCAIEQDRVELTELFLEKGADVNVADNYGETPLLAAAKSREADKLIPLLLKHGADVTARDIHGQNVLHWLVHARISSVGLANLVKALVAKGASTNDRTYESRFQPLHEAVQYGKIEMVELLLEHGANVDAREKYGKFPLYMATKVYTSVPLLETLLKHGANVNMKTRKRGRTALHSVCVVPLADRSTKCIQLFLSAGADICIEDQDGKTAFALLSKNFPWLYPISSEVMLMVKALALKRVCLPASIKLKDETIVKRHPKVWSFYQECIQYISNTKSTKIIESCSFLELLTKCHCQIAPFMRNERFESEFRKHDLEASFFMYSFDISEAFERAEHRYHKMLKQENVINEAVYNILPHLIVQKVVGYIFHCKMKKCASSRKQRG